jgi:uncharacterized protein (DUF433 family)
MDQLTRITFDPAIMGGKACVRGMRVTVDAVSGLIAAGRSRDEVLAAYPYLESEDIDQCLAYAASRSGTEASDDDDDDLTDNLLASNEAFRAMVAKSKASPRKPFMTEPHQ